MEARHSSVSTLRRVQSPGTASFTRGGAGGVGGGGDAVAPLGLGSGLSPVRVAARPGGGGGGGGGGGLRRQWTLAKGHQLLRPPAALPLFDMGVAVLDSLNLMRASVEEEFVLQSALGVPAHHALACRLEVFGSPFAAPQLRGDSSELTEAGKVFAACLAAPPEHDAVGGGPLEPTLSLQRMASIGVMQRAELARAAGAGAGQAHSKEAGPADGGALLRMPSVQPDKTDKKVEALAKSGGPGAGEEEGAEQQQQQRQRRQPSVSTPEGRAALAALAREAAARRPATWGCLFDAGRDAVAALVGCGFLVLRAARFDRAAPRAVEGLRRMASIGSAPGGNGGGGNGGGNSVDAAGASALRRMLSASMPPLGEFAAG